MRKRSFATWAFSLVVIAISRIPFLSPSKAIPSSLYIRFNRVMAFKSISKGETKYNMEKAGINHWPEEERPREGLIKEGADHLFPAQLLGVVLRCAIVGVVSPGRTSTMSPGIISSISTA